MQPKYKPGDKVNFIFNHEIFPCKIVKYLLTNIDHLYSVEFPPNSYAGSVENPRRIIEGYLKKIKLEDNNLEDKDLKRIINIVI